MWEGNQRINLLGQFAPWALTSATAACAVDGVVCCMRSLPSGMAEMAPVSEDHPLAECRHFLACTTLETSLDCEGDSIQAFYGRLGVVLLGTALDGECGLDTACRMLGLPQTASCRDELRREIADYLLERHECPWMHQLLAVCQELPMEDVERFRSGGGSSVGVDLTLENGHHSQANPSMPQPQTTSAVAVKTDEECRIVVGHEIEAVETVEALKWATGMVDNGVIHGLLTSLPDWSLKEQILAYRGRDSTPQNLASKTRKIKVDPKSLSVRDAVAQAFEEYLRSCAIPSGERLPRGRVK